MRVFLTPEQVVEKYPVFSKGTLANLRYAGRGGPPFFKVRRKIIYDEEQFMDWLTSCRVDPGKQPEKAPQKLTVRRKRNSSSDNFDERVSAPVSDSPERAQLSARRKRKGRKEATVE